MTPRIVEVDALDCAYTPRDWAFARERAADIDAHWRSVTAGNPAVFNGRVLLLHEGEVRGRVFHGAYLETDYKSFLAWRDFGAPDKTVRNCFGMAALRCDDGAFLIGEMNAHTSNAGKIYFAAGTPEPGDISGGAVDLTASVLRELEEETGLAPGEVTLGEGWTLVFHGYRVACMKRVRAAGPAEARKARIDTWLAAQSQPELVRMHVYRQRGDVDAARMPEFMQAYLDFALIAGY